MKRGLEIIPVVTVDDVIEHALVSRPVPIEEEEDEIEAFADSKDPKAETENVVTH